MLFSASSLRKSENIVFAGVGMNLSSVCSASELFTCWSTTGNGDPFSTEPTTQAISSTETMLTTEPPTESSDGRRAPGHRGPHGGADGGGDELPDHGEADQQDDRDDVLLGLAADQGAGDGRAELRAEQRAADEAEEAEHADDEALPVAGHGERGHDHDQDEVEHITAHDLTV